MSSRINLFMFVVATLPGIALAQKKYGMFDEGHKFDPPLYIVLVDKQYTQNGVIDDDGYFMTSEKVDGEKVFFAGAHSDVRTIGGPFRTVEEMAAVLPDKAVAWNGDLTRFVTKPAGAQAAGSGTSRFSTNQPLKGNVLADLNPDQMSDDSDRTRDRDDRRQRTVFPSLATMLFGMEPEDGELKGKVFTVHPDGSTNYLLGTFDIINRDEMRIFPAGGDTIHVMTLKAPEGGILEADYVHYFTARGAGQAAIPRDDRTRSSGKLDFILSGGPTVDAMMQQIRVAVAHGPPGGTLATEEARLAPFPVRFIPDP
jgi:hypothetical protein